MAKKVIETKMSEILSAIQERGRIETSFEVDGDLTVLAVDTVFNCKNGTFKITTHLTTTHVSSNGDMQDAVLQRLNGMLLGAMNKMLDRRDSWVEEHPDAGKEDPDQMKFGFDKEE